jgi:hypothetical protein
MSKKFRLLMALVLVVGLFGGLLTASTVSADPTVGDFIEIPRIDVDDVFGTGDWDTKIQIQNVGFCDTTVTVHFWDAYSNLCPPNTGDLDDGWFYEVMQWVPAGGVWTLHQAIPAGAESAIVTHVEDDEECDTDLAVTVDREGPDAYGDVVISSSYVAIVDPWMTGWGPPFEYYAPYVMHGYNNLDTTITIQNSGEICASIWIYYKEEANCEFQKAQHIELIAPGESIRIGPGDDADVGYPGTNPGEPGAGNWLGSAYVTANVPLAIVVDQLSLTAGPTGNQGTLLSMRGQPWATGDTKWYADLIYREISGYTTSIQVQNLTPDSQPTFVTVAFYDQSGDEILFVGDWVCRNAAATFYLPAIVDLGINFPFGYVGAAEIQSSWQVDYPGGLHAGEEIQVVVDIKKTKVWDGAAWRHTVAGETQGGAYNAHPWHQKVDAWGWAMPFVAKEQEGVTSRIAIRNNSNCVKIDGTIYIQDETGNTVAFIPVGWLHPKHMTIKDLNYFGQIWPGFVGAAEFWVEDWEQLCDWDGDGETDMNPVMPSVVVLNYGYEAELDPFNPVPSALPQTTLGDLTRVYEATPFGYAPMPCVVNFSGNVVDESLNPLEDAEITLDGAVMGTTDVSGYYSFDVWTDMTWHIGGPGQTFVVGVQKTGYTVDPVTLEGVYCDDQVVNFQLPVCMEVWVSGVVWDNETGDPIEGAEVTATNSEGNATATTAADGSYTVGPLPYDPNDATWVTATAEGYNPMTDSLWIPCGDTAGVDFQLHSSPMSRILLYYGNDGNAPDVTPPDPGPTAWVTPHNYYAAQAMFQYMGYIVDYTADWPADPLLDQYKVIFLLGPGNHNPIYDDHPDSWFTPGQVAGIDLFLRHGGRLVIMTDADEGLSAENTLIGALNDLDFAFEDNTTNWSNWIDNALSDQITADQLTYGVSTLDFDTATNLEVNVGCAPGLLAELPFPHLWAGADMLAADTMPGVTRLPGYAEACPTLLCNFNPGFAGDVVLIGDKDWMDDPSFMGDVTYTGGTPSYFWPDWPADNENLLLNIIDF